MTGHARLAAVLTVCALTGAGWWLAHRVRGGRALRDAPAWRVEGPRDVLDDGPWGPA